jgi:hypothetical protein
MLMNNPDSGKNCIQLSELEDRKQGKSPLDPNYYPVLPLIFFLVYKQSNGEYKIDLKKLLENYPDLPSDAMEYLEGLQRRQAATVHIEGDAEEEIIRLPQSSPPPPPPTSNLPQFAASGRPKSNNDGEYKNSRGKMHRTGNALKLAELTYEAEGKSDTFEHLLGGGMLDPLREQYHAWKNIFHSSPTQSGGSEESTNLRFSPKTVGPILEEQESWEKMNTAYNNLSEEHKAMFEPPEPSPVHSVVEIFHTYIDENADPEALEEARNTVGLLTPEEANEAMEKDTPWFDQIVSAYSSVFSGLNPEWVPMMARADMIRVLTGAT